MKCPECGWPRSRTLARRYSKVNPLRRVNYKRCSKCKVKFRVIETALLNADSRNNPPVPPAFR